MLICQLNHPEAFSCQKRCKYRGWAAAVLRGPRGGRGHDSAGVLLLWGGFKAGLGKTPRGGGAVGVTPPGDRCWRGGPLWTDRRVLGGQGKVRDFAAAPSRGSAL